MDIQELHDQVVALQETIDSKNLQGRVSAHVNWVGDEFEVRLSASEEYDSNGYWKREIDFPGNCTDAELLLAKATSWAYNLPNEEDRAIEFMIQQLNKVVEKLPKGNTEASARAWSEITKMLMDRAEQLGQTGLPSPTSISPAASLDGPEDDDRPYAP